MIPHPDDYPRDWLALLQTPLSVAEATAFVTSEQAGGINLFLGTTRAENTANGQQLLALDYQAYEAMANRQLQDLARSARERWPIVKLALLHRIGQVPLGQPSVIIAVSTPHRAPCFEACQWLIDELKKVVTIWKQEVWEDGSTSWVSPPVEMKKDLPA